VRVSSVIKVQSRGISFDVVAAVAVITPFVPVEQSARNLREGHLVLARVMLISSESVSMRLWNVVSAPLPDFWRRMDGLLMKHGSHVLLGVPSM